jgi:hypothetical protein
MNLNFDPAAFLDLPVEVEFKKRDPLPVGDYIGTITEVSARPWQGKQDPTKSGMAYDVQIALEVPEATRTLLGLQNPTLTLKDSIMLDLTDQGALDGAPGRNRALRNYREALDMNKPGVTFRAREMQGKLIRVKIGHEIYKDSPVERIEGVAKV